jgi:hypothetical protein
MRKKDCAPTIKKNVYRKNDIMFVPRHNGPGWVGPGYYWENNKIYYEEDFTKMGAVRSSHELWDLK